MVVFRHVAMAARRSPIAARGFVQRAAYQTTAVRLAGKESALHHEGRAEDVEREKQAHHQKRKEGKGEWHEGLASDSESIVKADRGEIKADQETIKKLQEESKNLADKGKTA